MATDTPKGVHEAGLDRARLRCFLSSPWLKRGVTRKDGVMYLDKSLQEYLDDLASDKPTPGGGSTAALSGAMGAALVCMVARLTLGKADYTAVQPEI